MSWNDAMEQVPDQQRRDFLAALEEAIAAARPEKQHLALILIDLANLSRINHNHGYETGDKMLASAFRYLEEIAQDSNTVFRVGCHRFALILPRLESPSFIALALNKVNGLLKRDLFSDAGMVSARLKVGIALNKEAARDTMAMLALAESSMSLVKSGITHQLHDLLAQDRGEVLDHSLEVSFAKALRDNSFELCFQPKVNLRTGAIENAEALLRWTTEDGEVISPETVVTLAESTGRAYELTRWVTHKSMRQLKEWQGSLDLGLALNVQAGLVGDPDWPSLLLDAISIWGVDPGKVTVEITEDAIMEDKEAGYNNLLKIREQGINISIDDFGTGYSSLSYFKHIPANELKIDKAFVNSMHTTPEDLELIKIMVHIAHQFGLVVVAEGIEDQRSMEQLREIGCDYGQGYHFSAPLRSSEFETWVQDWRGPPGPGTS